MRKETEKERERESVEAGLFIDRTVETQFGCCKVSKLCKTQRPRARDGEID